MHIFVETLVWIFVSSSFIISVNEDPSLRIERFAITYLYVVFPQSSLGIPIRSNTLYFYGKYTYKTKSFIFKLNVHTDLKHTNEQTSYLLSSKLSYLEQTRIL